MPASPSICQPGPEHTVVIRHSVTRYPLNPFRHGVMTCGVLPQSFTYFAVPRGPDKHNHTQATAIFISESLTGDLYVELSV